MASISKPIWFYGLEPLAERVLPPKDDGLRRVAFAQLAQVGLRDVEQAVNRPEDEIGRLSRALPLWLAETFFFSPGYSPIAALGYLERDGRRQPMIFAAEWVTDNLRQLLDSAQGGLDYVFTGAIRHHAGDYEMTLRVWEMKKFRQRKQFDVRWTPATAEAELGQLHAQIRQFMEWAPYPAGAGLAYAPPASPTAWLESLGTSLGLFMAEKKLMPPELLRPAGPALEALARQAPASPAASLAWLTAASRARGLGLAPDPLPAAVLAEDPLVAEACAALGL